MVFTRKKNLRDKRSYKVTKIVWNEELEMVSGDEVLIPTIKHGDKVLRGESDCIEYIDEIFPPLKQFHPSLLDTTQANKNLYC